MPILSNLTPATQPPKSAQVIFCRFLMALADFFFFLFTDFLYFSIEPGGIVRKNWRGRRDGRLFFFLGRLWRMSNPCPIARKHKASFLSDNSWGSPTSFYFP